MGRMAGQIVDLATDDALLEAKLKDLMRHLCEVVRVELVELADGGMDKGLAALLLEHIASCPVCLEAFLNVLKARKEATNLYSI